MPRTSNHAMERTAGRCALTFQMTSTLRLRIDTRPRPPSLILFSLDVMTPREEEYLHYKECSDSLNTAWRICRELVATRPAPAIYDAALRFALIAYARPYTRSDGTHRAGRAGYCRPSPSYLSPQQLRLHHDAFVAIPRWSWGASALSWCFLVMGICLLVIDLEMIYYGLRGRIVDEAVRHAEEVCLALPPLILGAVLQYSFVRERLRSAPVADATNV
jgi:hypothetical protein